MTKLTLDDVKHVAKLANLDLTEAELEKFTSQLSSVVDNFNDLNEVDVTHTDPTSQTTGLENVTREDKVTNDNPLTQEQAVSGTDENYNGYFKVKAILTERSDK